MIIIIIIMITMHIQVEIIAVEPHSHCGQMREECEFKVIRNWRMRGGWTVEDTLWEFDGEKKEEIKLWSVDAKDIILTNVRKSIKHGIMEYAKNCLLKNVLPLDCIWESGFYGKPDIFIKYENDVNKIENDI